MVIISDVDVEESTEPPLRNLPRPTKHFSFELAEPAPTHADGSLATLPEICSSAHLLSIDHLSHALVVDLQHGLSRTEATTRLERDGPNKVEAGQGVSIWQILLRQISNSLTLVLLITMILAFSMLDYIEGAVVAAVILLNITIGFVQDYSAEKTILTLQSLSAPSCKVFRDGVLEVSKAEHLVVGDVIHLVTGDIVPADVRLIDGMNLSTDEAALTGESMPVVKAPDAVLSGDHIIAIGDRLNMAYAASTVTQGRARALVVATGMQTEVGKISRLLQQDGDGDHAGQNILVRVWKRFIRVGKHALGLASGSPLQVKLSKFALLLFALAVLLAIIVFSANVWDIKDDVLIYGICVAVAVIPESIIAVLTITNALATRAMAKHNVIVRQMPSLEAVGGVTNICSDKTGTLTQGKMIASKALLPEGISIAIRDTNDPLDPTTGKTELSSKVKIAELEKHPAVVQFLDIVALCNMAAVTNIDKATSETSSSITLTPTWSAVGEPTEIALQVLAMRFKHGKEELLAENARKLLAEHPFDSKLKRMTVAYSAEPEGHAMVYSKGAVEAVVPMLRCSAAEKDEIMTTADVMAADGLRVLCLAHKRVVPTDSLKLSDRLFAESELEYAGLVGLYDPPRNETAEAVQKCQLAGIKVHMLTGDHIRTAVAIAAEVGIIQSAFAAFAPGNPTAMLASDFDKLTDTEIDNVATLPLVLARCSPSTKVRMVEALHRRKCFCVMTGDGVNDSPALKRADVGIAMGLNGSDVAKQAADMVLVDDDFASIVRAVEEGRRLFDNIQKFLLHLLTSNIAQVLLLLIGLAFKDINDASVFPLAPLEILWVNLITSSFLALGLGLESAVPNIMQRGPRTTGVFSRELLLDKMVYGCTMGSLCLLAFVAVVYSSAPPSPAVVLRDLAAGGNGSVSRRLNLGHGCNQDFNASCGVVFRARATVFAVLTFTLLATAWEVKDFRRSLFNMRAKRTQADDVERETDREGKKGQGEGKTDKETASSSSWPSIFTTIYENRFLFWSVVAGFTLTFPIIYLPVVNVRVFKHVGITWEWGVVFACLVVYVAVIEAWKAAKRAFYHRRREGVEEQGQQEERKGDGEGV